MIRSGDNDWLILSIFDLLPRHLSSEEIKIMQGQSVCMHACVRVHLLHDHRMRFQNKRIYKESSNWASEMTKRKSFILRINVILKQKHRDSIHTDDIKCFVWTHYTLGAALGLQSLRRRGFESHFWHQIFFHVPFFNFFHFWLCFLVIITKIHINICFPFSLLSFIFISTKKICHHLNKLRVKIRYLNSSRSQSILSTVSYLQIRNNAKTNRIQRRLIIRKSNLHSLWM